MNWRFLKLLFLGIPEKETDNFKREKVYGEKISSHVLQSLGKSQRTIEGAI